MIAIIDYGVGNLASVRKSLDHLAHSAEVTASPEDIRRASKLILPGVGHFGSTQALADLGLRDAIVEAIDRGVPFLGICVGMQWMFEKSAEAPLVPGLGIFPGSCDFFPARVKSPHVGWNTLQVKRPSCLLHDVSTGDFVYYSHSYRAPVGDHTVASTEYGEHFAAVVERDNAFGVQFHPEKSGRAGLQILDSFCRLRC